MIKRLSTGVLISILAGPALADIYRCEIDGVVVFADAPCQPDALPYESDSGISVVEAPSNLAEIEAANQALIQHRRAQQAQRAAAARQSARTPGPPMLRREVVPFIPVYALPRYHYDDRRQPVRTPYPVDDTQREQRYSALSGRLPGTRRREQDN